MNLLARTKSSTLLFSHFSSSGKHLCYRHSITALQQCNFYATKTTYTKSKTQKSFKPPSIVYQRIKTQMEAPATVWPRPGEMPYQAKVANFVNLIGNVKIPVQFGSDSDGKHFATTVISLGNGDEKHPLLVPVVFEGNMAHIVACHVKEDDCVFVSGNLSAGPLRLISIEKFGKFHVVAENLNFVEGFEKGVPDTKIGVSNLALDISDISKFCMVSSMKSSSKPLLNAEPLPKLPTLELGNALDISKFCRDSYVKSYSKPLLNAKPLPELATLELGNAGILSKKDGDMIGESFTKKKDANHMWDLWRDLVRNPLQWYDYRNHKTNGLVAEKFPDFKQKDTGESLWIRSAPKWVLPGLGKLEFDVKDLKPKHKQGGERPSANNRNSKLEESWKNLVENPNKWWDNRVNKRNPKAPDFRHKETGEGLWLNRSPVWALSKLPPT